MYTIAVRERVRVHYIATDRSQGEKMRMDCHRLTFCGDEMQSVSKILRSSSASCASRVSASSDAIPSFRPRASNERGRETSTRTRHFRTRNEPAWGREPAATPTKRLRDLNVDERRDACDRNASIRENSPRSLRALPFEAKEPSEALLLR